MLILDDSDCKLYPTFNQDNNEYQLAMEQTGIKVGKNGFEKDKDAEKLTDSPEFPDEQKTHITDAWDSFYLGLNFYCSELKGMMGGEFLCW